MPTAARCWIRSHGYGYGVRCLRFSSVSGKLHYAHSPRLTLPLPLPLTPLHRSFSASASSSSSDSSSSSPSSSSSSHFPDPPRHTGFCRMPAQPEPRPKPTTAVAVVEQYLDKLWRDFFTNPNNWMDNRLRKRAPKYADFKNKLTKEGLWINARWNPPWVRTELSLMTNFRPVPMDVVPESDEKVEGQSAEKQSVRVDAQPKPVSRVEAGNGQIRTDVWRRSDNTGGSKE